MDCLIVGIEVPLDTADSVGEKALQSKRDDVAFVDLEWRDDTLILKHLEVLLKTSCNVLDGSITSDNAQ